MLARTNVPGPDWTGRAGDNDMFAKLKVAALAAGVSTLLAGAASAQCVTKAANATAAKLAAPLKEGDHIELSGRISIYEARGEFQITVNEVRLKGLGQLYEAYEKLKAKLQAEGLFDEGGRQALPRFPRAIGIVTSLKAAALRDVLTTLRRRARFPLVDFVVAGRPFQALDGGPQFPHSEAVSVVVPCEDQAEADAYWDALLVGGEPSQCGWLTDRFGVSWQIVPVQLPALLGEADAARAGA